MYFQHFARNVPYHREIGRETTAVALPGGFWVLALRGFFVLGFGLSLGLVLLEEGRVYEYFSGCRGSWS